PWGDCRRLHHPYHLLDERPYSGRLRPELAPRMGKERRRGGDAMRGHWPLSPGKLEFPEDRDRLLDKGRGVGNTSRAPVPRLLWSGGLFFRSLDRALLRYPEDFWGKP